MPHLGGHQSQQKVIDQSKINLDLLYLIFVSIYLDLRSSKFISVNLLLLIYILEYIILQRSL